MAFVFVGVALLLALIAGIALAVIAWIRWQGSLSVSSEGERVLELMEEGRGPTTPPAEALDVVD